MGLIDLTTNKEVFQRGIAVVENAGAAQVAALPQMGIVDKDGRLYQIDAPQLVLGEFFTYDPKSVIVLNPTGQNGQPFTLDDITTGILFNEMQDKMLTPVLHSANNWRYELQNAAGTIVYAYQDNVHPDKASAIAGGANGNYFVPVTNSFFGFGSVTGEPRSRAFLANFSSGGYLFSIVGDLYFQSDFDFLRYWFEDDYGNALSPHFRAMSSARDANNVPIFPVIGPLANGFPLLKIPEGKSLYFAMTNDDQFGASSEFLLTVAT